VLRVRTLDVDGSGNITQGVTFSIILPVQLECFHVSVAALLTLAYCIGSGLLLRKKPKAKGILKKCVQHRATSPLCQAQEHLSAAKRVTFTEFPKAESKDLSTVVPLQQSVGMWDQPVSTRIKAKATIVRTAASHAARARGGSRVEAQKSHCLPSDPSTEQNRHQQARLSPKRNRNPLCEENIDVLSPPKRTKAKSH